MVRLLHILPCLLNVVAFAFAKSEFDERSECTLHVRYDLEVGLLESVKGCTGYNHAQDTLCGISQCRDWLVYGETYCNIWHKCETRCKKILKEKLDNDDSHNILRVVAPDKNGNKKVIYDREVCIAPSDVLDLDPCINCYQGRDEKGKGLPYPSRHPWTN